MLLHSGQHCKRDSYHFFAEDVVSLAISLKKNQQTHTQNNKPKPFSFSMLEIYCNILKAT